MASKQALRNKPAPEWTPKKIVIRGISLPATSMQIAALADRKSRALRGPTADKPDAR